MKRTIVIFSSVAAFMAFAAFAFVPAAHARNSARVQACADKSAGDPCSFTRKGAEVDGTCKAKRHGKLICKATSASGGGAMAPSGGAAGDATGGAMGSPSNGAAGGDTSGGGEAPPPSNP